MADLKCVANDENIHIFRHEAPGQYHHFMRKRWLNSSHEVRIDNLIWSLDEVKVWIENNKAGNGMGEITESELKWVHDAVLKGFKGEAAIEPDPDPTRERPKTFQCVTCHKIFPYDQRRKLSWSVFKDDQGFCPECFGRGYRGRGF